MIYPKEVIDEVQAKSDIVDVISGYISLQKKGSDYVCCCPFHSDRSPSFYVHRKKRFFYCFGCQEGGDVIKFVEKYENVSFPEALKILADRAGIALPEVHLSAEERNRVDRESRLKEVNYDAAAYFHYLLTKTERGKAGYTYYREKRRFTDDTIRQFALGYADVYRDDLYRYLKEKKGYPDDLIRDSGLVDFNEKDGAHDKFWNRVMVPIRDLHGKVIAFGGRVLGDGKPKYMNSRETDIFDKSRNLFALNLARKSKRRGVILCEGYMDVITQHQAGFDNAVASLGTAFTERQAALISRYTKEVYLAYDSDGAGTTAALKAIEKLRSLGMSQRVVDLSPYKDPDEFLSAMGPEAYEERIRNAVSGRTFEIRQLAKNTRMDDPEERAGFMRGIAASLAEIEDVSERASYLESFALEYDLQKEVLREEVTRIALAGKTEQKSYRGSPGRGDPGGGQSGRSDDAGERKAKNQISPEEKAEAHLLTWIVDRPELIRKLDGYISEEDFIGPTTGKVAAGIFRQYRETGTIQAGRLFRELPVSEGEDEQGEQSRIAQILDTKMPFETDPEMAGKALTELVKKIRTNRLDRELMNSTGNRLKLAAEKAKVGKIRIRIDQ